MKQVRSKSILNGIESVSALECIAKMSPITDEFQVRELGLQVPVRPSVRSAAESKRPLVYIMATDQRGRRLTPGRPRGTAASFDVGLGRESGGGGGGGRGEQERKREREGGK